MSVIAWNSLLASGLSQDRLRDLYERFGADLDFEHIAQAKGWTHSESKQLEEVDQTSAQQAQELGAKVIGLNEYPEALQETPGAPAILFCRGSLEAVSRPGIAIVGTRRASTYGRAVARKFAERFASAGLTVISGGALGIDREAHVGALEGGGSTVSVMPCGIDRFYPSNNRDVFQQMLQPESQSALVSHFPCGQPSLEYTFLARNQVIAMMAVALLVVEAPENSGSLHTANAATECGKPVFVVPATIDMISFRGSHHLIRNGATLVENPDHVFEQLQVSFTSASGGNRADTLNDVQKAILGNMTASAMTPEQIGNASGIDPSEILQELTLLELEGAIIRTPSGYCIAP